MTKKRGPSFDLDAALEDPGFTPRIGDIPALLERVAGGDVTGPAGRALLRLGALGARAASERAPSEAAAPRARLVDLVARAVASLGPESADAQLVAFLCERLSDEEPRARRYAAVGLGKLRSGSEGAGEVAAALAAALGPETDAPARRAIATALGKVGGATAVAALGVSGGPELGDEERATRAKARLMAERTLGRARESVFDPSVEVAGPTRVVLRCRAGLEELLADELEPELRPTIPRDAWGPGRVEVTLIGAPARLFRARTMLSFGFALPLEPLEGGDLGNAVVRALTSDEAVALLARHTRGAVRFRIAWAAGGKRRAVVWRAAGEIAARRPELVNDPTESPWQAVVHEGRGAVAVELVPSFVDPRFPYRLGDVPAASHPTVAAALVRIAGVRADDVVWDPFVGSGTELCERALAGPYRRLIGSDREPLALEVARKNLEAVGAHDVELVRGDALRYAPSVPPTVIVTNPPMGRRVLRGVDLGAVLEQFVEHAARTLGPGGRLVWISPLPDRTVRAAQRAGLSSTLRREIDMGGFLAELQAFSAKRR